MKGGTYELWSVMPTVGRKPPEDVAPRILDDQEGRPSDQQLPAEGGEALAVPDT